MRTAGLLRAAAVSFGTMALALVGGLAFADETKHGEEEVQLKVKIADEEEGELAMTVAGTSVTLEENGSTGTVRQFEGTLPDVTVTDTRDPDGIDPTVFWYVVGSASNFAGDSGQADITPDHLGWLPAMVDQGESGLVGAGDQIDTVMDTASPNHQGGLVDAEFLAQANDTSQNLALERSWTANAALYLRVPATTPTGDYVSRLTLSLFE